tara:strand:- start:1068 stop:1568 length:501 start_codon:yes stop_codon:yes gene_type:complete
MIDQTKVELQEQLIIEHLKKLKDAEKNFLPFVNHVWPDFISGYHHRKISKKFEDIRSGKIKRLIVNMPPRHTKSEFASFLFPSWLVGNNPKLKIIQTTHNTELAVRFGRKMKNLIDSQIYQQVFDQVSISADSKAAGRWETNHGGEYFAAGVGSSNHGPWCRLIDH